MNLTWASESEQILDADGGIWAMVRQPKDEDVEGLLAGLEGVSRLVVRPLFEDAVGLNWLPGARDRWGRFAVALAGRAAERLPGLRLSVMPHAEAILSDIPGTMSFLRTMPGFGLVLNPAALLAESMRANRMDHLVRIVDTLVGHSSCEAVVVGETEGAHCDEWDREVLAAAREANRRIVVRSVSRK